MANDKGNQAPGTPAPGAGPDGGQIRRSAEERHGAPATAEGTEHGDHAGVLRIDFGSDDSNLRHGFAPATAIVTGSDSGIGRATAVALARSGLDIGITWHSDRQGAEETAEEVRRTGQAAVVRHLDTTDLPGAAAVIDALAEELGGVDVFVSNAGTGDNTKFLDLDVGAWMGTLDTNLNGAFVCMQAAARRMVAAGRGGRIVAVTSVHEFQPRVGSAAYDASKHGLGGLIKTMALELAEFGITANSVAPGEIATPMTGQTDQDPTETHRPGVPLGRPGHAYEVAAVIAFLASPASSYVTGASWAVDGGMLQMGPHAGSHITGHGWRNG